MPVACSQAAITAASGISCWQSTASAGGSSKSPTASFAPGETTIVVSPSSSTVISATPVGAIRLVEIELDPRCSQPGERLGSERVAPDGADHANIRAEPGARNGLVRALAAGKPLERRAGHRLAGTGQRRAARDEIEVDRADDADPGRGHSFSVTRAGAG